jgi:hypothetical protein
MKSDQPQRARSAICVFAQQYSSSTFATLRSAHRARKHKERLLKMLLFKVFYFKNGIKFEIALI